jgi:hypothetical protein
MHLHALEIISLPVLSGLLGPVEWRLRALRQQARWRRGDVGPRSDASVDRAVDAPVNLNAIELGLIADFSLEMARANEAVAEDATQGMETRRRASEVAMSWRQRAELFHSHARRQGAQPILPDPHAVHVARQAYSGPERRTQMRRRQTRRIDPASSAGHDHDRRAGAERRQRDRRRPELAPR